MLQKLRVFLLDCVIKSGNFSHTQCSLFFTHLNLENDQSKNKYFSRLLKSAEDPCFKEDL